MRVNKIQIMQEQSHRNLRINNSNPSEMQQQFISDQSDMQMVEISHNQILHRYHSRFDLLIKQLSEKSSKPALHPLSTQIANSLDLTNHNLVNSATVKIMIDNRINKMIENRKVKKNWNLNDTVILAWLLQYIYGIQCIHQPESIPESVWQKVSEHIPGTTPKDCMFKWLSIKYNKITVFKWEQNQEQLLKTIVQELDGEQGKQKPVGTVKRNWKQISRRLYLRNPDKNRKYRNGKQCQQRWENFLKSGIKKGNWTLEEDQRLLEYYCETKSKKWRQFLNVLPRRTENAIKNRFKLIIGKYQFMAPDLSEEQIIAIHLEYLRNQITELSESKSHSITNQEKNMNMFFADNYDPQFGFNQSKNEGDENHDLQEKCLHISESLTIEKIAEIINKYKNLEASQPYVPIKTYSGLQEEIEEFLNEQNESEEEDEKYRKIPNHTIK